MIKTDKSPLIIAHRGASALAPENTLAAFQKAINDDAEGIEFDVRLAKDGVPMVFHDASLKRICGKKIKLAELTSEELQTLDAGSWFNQKNPEKAKQYFSNEKISTLEQILDFLRDYKGVIYVELKCKDKDVKSLSTAVCKIINKSSILSQIIVKSFKLEIIPYIQKYSPDVKTASLFAPKIMTILRKENRLINISKELKTNLISLHFSLATKKLMRKAKRQNLPIAIWTADSPRWVKRGVKLGIDHIITNNPARLLVKRSELLGKI